MNLRYSPFQQFLHWLTVALMLAILPVAWVAMALPEDTPRFYFVLDVHKSLGLTIFVVTVLRLLLRLVDPPPPHPRLMPGWNKVLAGLVVMGLLLVMLIMPISGYLWTTGHGYDVAPFEKVWLPRLFWNDRPVGDAAKAVHRWGQWAVYGLIALHSLGVTYHIVVRRDGVLNRMLPAQVNEDRFR